MTLQEELIKWDDKETVVARPESLECGTSNIFEGNFDNMPEMLQKMRTRERELVNITFVGKT